MKNFNYYYYYKDDVKNNKNSTNLRYFKITQLFGRYNIKLSFEKEVNIYIGENGLGKTTILNCLYYLLTKDFLKLETINFEELEIGFYNDDNIYSISKADILEYNKKISDRYHIYEDNLIRMVLEDTNLSIRELRDLDNKTISLILKKISLTHNIPFPILERRFFKLCNLDSINTSNYTKGNPKNIRNVIIAIDNNIKNNIIYLPTFRRIENSFNNLKINNLSISSNNLIQFGMSDVQESIDSILDNIRTISLDGYNKLSGSLLELYSQDSLKQETMGRFDLDIVNLVLDRLDNRITPSVKTNIMNLIKSEEIYDIRYSPLRNLLQKLVSNYKLQKEQDIKINYFIEICNKYLNDKHFVYNPSDLTIKIILNSDSNKTIDLTQLSSGEKQIVSIFSKLYLENNDDNILIIDEPELSLSIYWQKMFLPDIMRSKNCKLLITVTHSPFIFENEFDMDAKEIRSNMS